MTLGGCSRDEAVDRDTETIRVFVTIEPYAYLVDRIGGPRVTTWVLVGSGRSPATYEPTPRQMAALSRARVYFRTRVPCEAALLPKLTTLAPQLTMVDTLQGLRLRYMEGHHDHILESGAIDPHVWLDPRRVTVQARTIAKALASCDPDYRELYEQNLKRLVGDLARVDQRIETLLAPYRGRTFHVFHPALGYFAERYGLRQRSIEVEGKEPSLRQLGQFIEQARQDRVTVIFVQAQFSRESAEKIARAVGATVVSLDPLARDYLANLEAMAAAFAAALSRRDG